MHIRSQTILSTILLAGVVFAPISYGAMGDRDEAPSVPASAVPLGEHDKDRLRALASAITRFTREGTEASMRGEYSQAAAIADQYANALMELNTLCPGRGADKSAAEIRTQAEVLRAQAAGVALYQVARDAAEDLVNKLGPQSTWAEKKAAAIAEREAADKASAALFYKEAMEHYGKSQFRIISLIRSAPSLDEGAACEAMSEQLITAFHWAREYAVLQRVGYVRIKAVNKYFASRKEALLTGALASSGDPVGEGAVPGPAAAGAGAPADK